MVSSGQEKHSIFHKDAQFFYNIIETMSIPLSVVDTNENFVFLNKAYEKVFNVKREFLLGRHISYHLNEGEKSIHRIVQTTGKPYTDTKTMGNNNRLVLGEGLPIIIDEKIVASVVTLNEFSMVSKNMAVLGNARRVIKESEQQNARYSFKDIIFQSDCMGDAISKAKKAAITDVTVLLRGESGVGKELFAHAIHKASNRKNKNFIRVNCASLAETLLESILFGYTGCAFTGAKREGQIGLFEAADGGTIFLDEVGEISISMQNRLLRVLQEREITRVGDSKQIKIDVRVILATNADIESKVTKNEFREDFYYRINIFPVLIPALRYRRDDIKILADIFIKKFNNDYQRNIQIVEESYYEKLRNYDWPGNVRELENVVVRSILNTDLEQVKLQEESIQFKPIAESKKSGTDQTERSQKKYKELFEEWERDLISCAFDASGRNKSRMARDLDISIRSVYDKIKQYQL